MPRESRANVHVDESSQQPISDRCEYVHVESGVETHVCWREPWKERGRCVWHHDDTAGKTFYDLKRVRSDCWERLDGAKLDGVDMQFPDERSTGDADPYVTPELFARIGIDVDAETFLGDSDELRARLRDYFGDLEPISFEGCSLREATFDESHVDDVDFQNADLTNASFVGAHASQANFSGATLSGTDLSNANLTEASFTGAKLDGVTVVGARLTRADLSNATLSDVDLRRAIVTDADFSGVDLSEVDLSDVSFGGVTMVETTLRGSTLSGAEFTDADIRAADLSGTDLTRVRIRGSRLEDVDLSGANLSEADLSGSALVRANLRDASLSGVDLAAAHIDEPVAELRQFQTARITAATIVNSTSWTSLDGPVTIPIECDTGERLEAGDLAEFLARMEAVYRLVHDTNQRFVPWNSDLSDASDSRTEVLERIKSHGRAVAVDPSPEASLYIDAMSKQSPLEITLLGISSSLVVALILSGGRLELDTPLVTVKAKLPPIGEGLEQLAEGLDALQSVAGSARGSWGDDEQSTTERTTDDE